MNQSVRCYQCKGHNRIEKATLQHLTGQTDSGTDSGYDMYDKTRESRPEYLVLLSVSGSGMLSGTLLCSKDVIEFDWTVLAGI